MFNPLRNSLTPLLALLALGFHPAAPRAADLPDEGDNHTVIVTREKNGRGPARTRVIRMHGRPKLGLVVSPEAKAGNDEGAQVIAVSPGSPAAEAGLQVGDIILKANGKKLADYAAKRKTDRDDEDDEINPAARGLIEFSSELKTGDKVVLDYRRGSESRSVTLVARDLPAGRMRVIRKVGPDGKVEETILRGGAGHGDADDDDDVMINLPETPEMPEMPDMPEMPNFSFRGLPGAFMDLELAALNPDLGEYFGVRSGVLVTKAPEGNALPFKAGDVITKIGDREAKSPGQALRVLRSYEPGEKVSVEMIRHQKPMTVSVNIPERKERMKMRAAPPAPARVPTPPVPPRTPANT